MIMEKSLLSKMFVIGIIILFFEATFVSSISDDNEINSSNKGVVD
jgi:hypothetical protein